MAAWRASILVEQCEVEMNVTLRPALKKLVDDKVKAGEYASPNELMEAAVARLIFDPHRGELDEETLAALREGESQLERGEGIPAEAAFDRLRKKYCGQ